MAKQIERILNPRSIAVVGATTRRGSVGYAVFSNLIQGNYQGVLYPVNPRLPSVRGVKAYPSLEEVPDEIDLAVIIVPAPLVLDIVAQAGRKGVKGLVVITAGFKEVGGEGVELERRLKTLVQDLGIPLVGPNCLGVVNTDEAVQMNASFATKMPKQGNIAFISQSGALCTAVLDLAEARNIGFSKFISFGNKADVNEIDLLEFLRDDPQTQVILMYLEDISEGRRFIETASQTAWEAKKPILAVKSGVSPEGARAASSHTGSLAGSDTAYDAIFIQSGIQRVEGINELFNYAQAFATQPLPQGKRVAIVTNAGGPGIMATDAAVRHGLHLAAFSEETLGKLKDALPVTAAVHNPVDVIGDATHERYEAALRYVMEDEGVDGVVVILTPQAMTDIMETAEIVPRAAKVANKPLLSSFMGIVDVSAGVRHLQEHGIPNYIFPEAALRAMGALVHYSERMHKPKRHIPHVVARCEEAAAIIKGRLGDQESHFMTEHQAREVLACYGFPLVRGALVSRPEEIEAAARETGFPAVMKISSPDIIHKSEAGGVVLDIQDVPEAEAAFEQLMSRARAYKAEARLEGVLMVEMARPGVEVILGGTRDPKFGPMCMFGLGGIFVETFQDVSFRLAPMWESSAENMIRTIKGDRILQGVRGQPPSDVAAVKDCILRLSQMMVENPQISELDMNPIIVYPEGQGCVVADCRMLLRPAP